MHILVTRAEPDATALAARISALGHTTVISALLDIKTNRIDAKFCAGCGSVLATSRNGLVALAASPDALAAARALPIFTVGTATARLARELGFGDIIAGPGTAAELVPTVVQRRDLSAKPIVHLAGDHLAYDLAGELSARGCHVKAVQAYQSIAATHFSAAAERDVRAGAIDAVILMSPRTARIWSEIVNRDGLPAAAITHICLSQAVADGLFAGAQARIADVATLDAVLDAVQSLAGAPKTG